MCKTDLQSVPEYARLTKMKNLTEEQVMQIPKLREKMTAEQVAAHFGVSVTTITRWSAQLRKRGIVVPRQYRPRVLSV